MHKRRRNFAPSGSVFGESLERRLVLTASVVHQASAEVSVMAAHKARTATTLSITSGTLGQPITFTVTVRAPASTGSPEGVVKLTEHGKVFQTLTLSPSTSSNAKYAYSTASYTLTPQPGGSALFFGKYTISAQFVPSGTFVKSQVTKRFSVSQPAYTDLANGVQIATIANGSGPGVQSGQQANVLYTGYLAKNGYLFDDSAMHGGTPIGFRVATGQMIPGFDAGTEGMRVGETRLIRIPPSQAYGSAGTTGIPGNSTLIFIVTLQSIA